MNISYNMDFDMAAFLLMLIEIIYLRLQYSHEKYSNRLFIMLLHSSFLLCIVDIVNSLLLTGYANQVPVWCLRCVFSLYFLVNAFVTMVFYRYVVEYVGDKKETTVAYYVRTYFPFIFICECLIANHFANLFFAISRYGHFSYGNLIVITYVYPLYYFGLTFYTLHRNRKIISIKQHISVISFIFITLVSMIIQLFYSDIMSLAFGYSISLLIMLMTLETPDYRSLIETKELLGTVRREIEQRDYVNNLFIREMTSEISSPVEKMMNEEGINKNIEGYGRQIYVALNNMMEFSSLSESDIRETREYLLREMVDEVTGIIMPSINDNNNTFVVDVNNVVPNELLGMNLLLKQALINLISDANSYTKNGKIGLTINCRRIDIYNLNLIITIEDTGVGMKREMVKKLLQYNTKGRGWKADAFGDGNFRLKITKRMIEEMNGKLNIDSTVNKGSVFTIIIPQIVV